MIQTRISILRNKFFFLLGIIVFLSIFFIALTNFQTHENDLQLKIEKLELQNEAISKHVEVEKEQQHAERQLFERTKKELNQKLREQKDIHDKENHEAQLRFNSLQQQYKILSTEHDDLSAQSKKELQIKKELLTENDELKGRVHEVEAKYSKLQTLKKNDNEMWKVKFENILNEKEKLQKLLTGNSNINDDKEQEHTELLQLKYKNYQLQQEIKDLKKKLHINNDNNDDSHDRQVPSPVVSNKTVDKSFQGQILVSEDHYKIPINIRSKTHVVKESTNSIIKDNKNRDTQNKVFINAVENIQIVSDNNVLQQPNEKSFSTTTTSVSEKKKILKVLPSSSITTTKSTKKLPKFVLPIPNFKNEEDLSKDTMKGNDDDEENKKLVFDETLNKPQNDDINELENVAHEINDNDFNIEERNQKNHFDNLDQDRNNIVNNAAEEFDGHKQIDKKTLGDEEMDLEIINRPANGGNVKDKLKDEIANDHGKEDGYLEDLHMQEQPDPDEDLGDIGEYDDPKFVKQGAAERN